MQRSSPVLSLVANSAAVDRVWGGIRIPIFFVLNFAIIGLTLATASIIRDINTWHNEVTLIIQDPQHAPFITTNYIILPAIHVGISFMVISCSYIVLIKFKRVVHALAIAIGFMVYLIDVIMMPIFFLLVLPSPKFDHCYYWFTQPGAITNDEASHGCYLLTGPLYKVTIAGLCIMAVIVLMWIPLLSHDRSPISYPPIPTVPQTRFPTGAELDARAESNPGNFAPTNNKDTRKEDIIPPAHQLEDPTTSRSTNVPSEKDDADDVVQDGAG